MEKEGYAGSYTQSLVKAVMEGMMDAD